MKVIIDIPNFIYRTLIETGKYGFYRFDAKKAIKYGTPLDNLRVELTDYITHSPYITGCTNCCRLRDDVMRIIDKYMEEQ